MILLLILLLPAFIAAGLIYLIATMGDAITSAAVDWVDERRGGGSRD